MSGVMQSDIDYLITWYETSCSRDQVQTNNGSHMEYGSGTNTTDDHLVAPADLIGSPNVDAYALCQNLSVLMEYYDYDSELSSTHPEMYIVPLIFGVTFLVGLLGNGLVIYVVLKSGATTTVTNLYLMNLAVSDVMFLVFCVPFTAVTYVLPYWPFGESMCKVVNYMMVVTVASTVITMTILSIDRYHAVVHPVSSKRYRTPRRTIAILAVMWIIILTTLSPVAAISKVVQYWYHGSDNDFCVEHFDDPLLRKAYTLILFVTLYVVPLSIIGLSYYLMAKTLWNSVSPGFLRDNTARALQARKRVSKMILVIIMAFAVCWLPIHCVQIHADFATPTYTTTHDVIKIVAHVLSYVNSALNPMIYGFMSQNFRKYSRIACSGICQVKPRKQQARRNVFIVVDPAPVMPNSTSSGRSRAHSIRNPELTTNLKAITYTSVTCESAL